MAPGAETLHQHSTQSHLLAAAPESHRRRPAGQRQLGWRDCGVAGRCAACATRHTYFRCAVLGTRCILEWPSVLCNDLTVSIHAAAAFAGCCVHGSVHALNTMHLAVHTPFPPHGVAAAETRMGLLLLLHGSPRSTYAPAAPAAGLSGTVSPLG